MELSLKLGAIREKGTSLSLWSCTILHLLSSVFTSLYSLDILGFSLLTVVRFSKIDTSIKLANREP